LGEEHEQSVETFVEMGIPFWFKKLKTQICQLSASQRSKCE
jgi:hypothetical protein